MSLFLNSFVRGLFCKCLNHCDVCVLPTLTAKQRRKRRVRRLWMITRCFPALCGDLLRVLVLEWFSEQSPVFSTFTLRCAVYAYRCNPRNATVRSWGPIRYWDTSRVTCFDRLFAYDRGFNERLSWDTSNAVSMESMFEGTASFNQRIEFRFDKVRTTARMFARTNAFNHPICAHNAPHWQSAREMFSAARAMNANVFCNAPNLTDVYRMFIDAEAFRAVVVLTSD